MAEYEYEYEYDEDLPYVVPYGDGDHARFSSKSIAYLFASDYTQNAVIDTTPKPRVPEDAEFITYIDSYAARLYAQRCADGVQWSDGGGRVYLLEELPGVNADTEFAVLDVRKQP